MATQTPSQPAVPFAAQRATAQLLTPSGNFGGDTGSHPGAAPGGFSPRSSDSGSELVAADKRRPAATSDSDFRTLSELPLATGEPFHGLRLSHSLERMPVDMRVAIPVRDFRVRNLLALSPGELIATQWANGDDLPLVSGEVQLAWSEFEVVDTRLAVRVTRLA